MSSTSLGRLIPAVFTALALPALAHAADAIPPTDPNAALDRALQGLAPGSPGPAASQAAAPATSAPLMQIGGAGGSPTLKLADISLDINTVAGTSTATDAQIADLQGGDHDPKRRGFSLQQAELSLFGAVDPYFNAEAHIVFKSDAVELEEAYGTSTSLPAGLQLKVGYYLTEFGRTNPQHPHQWPWLDQPVVNTRMFGPDGNRGVGARLSWLTPLPWFSELFLGVQNPDDDTEHSFLGGEVDANGVKTTVGGRPAVEHPTGNLGDMLISTRWVNNWELPRNVMMQFGASAAFGPNATGASAHTTIVGADLLVKWREGTRGYPNVAWQSEVIGRVFHADPGSDPLTAAAIPNDTLRDWGLSSQVVVGLDPRWAVGVRIDHATGSGDSYEIGTGAIDRQSDPLRDDRWRLSPLITFNPTEFSKVRLQYDYDHAEHLPDQAAHSVWLGLELMIGAHPAHTY